MTFQRPRTARVCLISLAVLFVTGCADDGGDLLTPETARTIPNRSGVSQTEGEFRSIPRVDVEIEAAGPFLPGVPIAVTARATAQRAAVGADIELLVLDPGPRDFATARQPVRLDRTQGDLPAGAARRLEAGVSFAEPGYYRVLARSTAEAPDGGAPVSRQDTIVRPLDTALLWIVVDEEGGRLTNGYDESVIDAQHLPLYGAYGPFRERRVQFAPPMLGLDGVGGSWIMGSAHRRWMSHGSAGLLLRDRPARARPHRALSTVTVPNGASSSNTLQGGVE